MKYVVNNVVDGGAWSERVLYCLSVWLPTMMINCQPTSKLPLTCQPNSHHGVQNGAGGVNDGGGGERTAAKVLTMS